MIDAAELKPGFEFKPGMILTNMQGLKVPIPAGLASVLLPTMDGHYIVTTIGEDEPIEPGMVFNHIGQPGEVTVVRLVINASDQEEHNNLITGEDYVVVRNQNGMEISWIDRDFRLSHHRIPQDAIPNPMDVAVQSIGFRDSISVEVDKPE